METEMSEDNEGRFDLTEPTTLTFPNLLEAKAVQVKGKPSGEPKYSSNFEFEPESDDLRALKAKAVAVARAKWPGRDLKELAFPFTNGDKLAEKAKAKGKDREFSRGKVVVTARSKYQPRMSVVEGGRIVDLEGDAIKANGRKFYSGVQALAQFNLVAYDGVGNNPDGVTAYLNMVLSINKGTKLAGGASASEVFKGYIGTASDEDPTGLDGLDDEIPF